MNGLRAVFVKELNEYFATPIALAVVAVFWALCGYLFSFNLFFVNQIRLKSSESFVQISVIQRITLIQIYR